MRRTTAYAILTGSALLLAACSKTETASAPAKSEQASSAPSPAEFKVKFDTSKGPFIIDVHRDWAPNGADRFYELVNNGFYNDARFFRVVPNFVIQWGIHKDPATSAKWRAMNIPDDPVTQSNKRGYVTYATGGPNTRTTQLFINLGDNTPLDGQGFAPFGQVTDGMDIVQSLYAGYGQTPDQGQIQMEGNAYLQSQFPNLDYIKSTTVQK